MKKFLLLVCLFICSATNAYAQEGLSSGISGFPGSLNSGTGNVTGPASAVSGHIATFNGTTGTIIQDGGAVNLVPSFTANTISSSGTTACAWGNAYFVTATSGTCIFTIPTAVNNAGQEIFICLIASGATVQLNTTSSQTISGQASTAITTTVEYNGYRVVSDGANIQLE